MKQEKKHEENSGIEIQEGREYVSKTIVGGRPLLRRKKKVSIPVGVEKVLYKAAIDPEFRKILFENRKKVIESEEFHLSQSEKLILGNATESALIAMIDGIKPVQHGRRKFMKAVAAAVVTLAAGSAFVRCEEEKVKGDIPEDPEDVKIDEQFEFVYGDTADFPERDDG